MAKARVNGIEIDYEDTGQGRPVLLTHGHLSSRTAWDGQHQALADRYRVISWDIRGHGQTETPDDPAQYSLELTIADIHALLGTSASSARSSAVSRLVAIFRWLLPSPIRKWSRRW